MLLGEENGAYASGSEQYYNCLRRLALVQPAAASGAEASDWERLPLGPAGESHYTLLLTTATPGSIPAQLWRTSHVIYL